MLGAEFSLQSPKAMVQQVQSEEHVLISSGRLNLEASYRGNVLLRLQSLAQAPQDTPRASLELISLSKFPNEEGRRKTPGGHRQKGYIHFTLPQTAQLPLPYLFSQRLSHMQESHTERDGSNPTAARWLYYWGILALEKLLPLACLRVFLSSSAPRKKPVSSFPPDQLVALPAS